MYDNRDTVVEKFQGLAVEMVVNTSLFSNKSTDGILEVISAIALAHGPTEYPVVASG